MSDDARFDPRFDPAFQPGYAGPLASAPSAAQPIPAQPIAAPPTALPTVTAPVTDAPAEEREDDHRINPFIIALAAVSVVLILGGVYLLSLLQQMFAASQESQTTFDYTTFQALIYGAPLLIALGIATAISILCMFASRWWRLRS
ncbi:uncharacterized protein HemX [Salinibacterium sp. CAN_S4]|uniref:hypothetical protein n=1 Tax=Salinibacterium sp. CAN_S4 TaxID=2787727 RepID=UPI0018EFBB11